MPGICTFINLLEHSRILESLCSFCPSAPIRLQRLCSPLNEFFSDERLSEYLPKTFEELGLYYSNPFTHCRNGDTESLWLMLVHGVDPRIVDNVRLFGFHIILLSERRNSPSGRDPVW